MGDASLARCAQLHTDSLYKEHKSYILEEEQQKIKLDKFVANKAEDWDIKNAVRVLLLQSIIHIDFAHATSI